MKLYYDFLNFICKMLRKATFVRETTIKYYGFPANLLFLEIDFIEFFHFL
jgi:hypothetical protein